MLILIVVVRKDFQGLFESCRYQIYADSIPSIRWSFPKRISTNWPPIRPVSSRKMSLQPWNS